MNVTVYHNPRCSKSRATLQLLRDRGIEPEIVEYLRTPPDEATLAAIVEALDIAPRELVRIGEAEYRESGLDDRRLSARQIIRGLCAHPRLIQRPIVVTPKGARIGRPPENVLEIL